MLWVNVGKWRRLEDGRVSFDQFGWGLWSSFCPISDDLVYGCEWVFIKRWRLPSSPKLTKFELNFPLFRHFRWATKLKQSITYKLISTYVSSVSSSGNWIQFHSHLHILFMAQTFNQIRNPIIQLNFLSASHSINFRMHFTTQSSRVDIFRIKNSHKYSRNHKVSSSTH